MLLLPPVGGAIFAGQEAIKQGKDPAEVALWAAGGAVAGFVLVIALGAGVSAGG